MGLTTEIGRFVAELSPDRVPAAALRIICDGFADCIAVLMAGWREPVTAIVANSIGRALPGHALTANCAQITAPDRALLYGTAAHVLDYDDVALSGHPSAVLVPAIQAEAHAVEADGKAMVAAYLAGYEVWAELIRRDRDRHHDKGWHPSAVFGTIAAAAAASVLRRLDADAAGHAIGIAASMTGGIIANFGSMTKSFQVGRAAQSGLLAVRMAELGMTASPDALEHRGGLLHALSPRGEVDRTSASRLGTDWAILDTGLNIKLYPVCYAAHRCLDGMIDICREHSIAASAIAAVEAEIGDTQAAMLRNHQPQSALDAKFSMEFAMAAAVVAGRCGLAELSDPFVRRADIQGLLRKVRIATRFDRLPEEPTLAAFDRVKLTLQDGGEITSQPIAYPRGHFKHPVDAAGLWTKFADCTARTLGEAPARSLFDRLQNLERLSSIAELAPSPRHLAEVD